MTQTCPTKMLKIAQNDPNWPEKTAQNCSKLLKIAQNGPASVYRGDVLAYYTGAKVVITWHCCCQCPLFHGLRVTVN